MTMFFASVAVLLLVCGIVALFIFLNRRQEGQISPLLLIDQLDKDSHGRLVSIHTFSVYEVPPEEGLSISRPDAERGDIFLKNAAKAYTVSEQHFWIAMDEKGFFGVDRGSTNGSFLYGSNRRVNTVDIENGTIIFLGRQAIRFRIPNLHADTGTIGRRTELMKGDDLYEQEPLKPLKRGSA